MIFQDEELMLPAEDLGEQNRIIITNSMFVMAIIGWLIIGSSLNTVVFLAIPFKPSSGEWWLSLYGQFLSCSPMILLGGMLILLASALKPKEKVLRNYALSFHRISSLLATLLTLGIPFQFFLGNQIINRQAAEAYSSIKRLQGIASNIQGLNSEADLRTYVSTLPEAPTLRAKFDAGFPAIKERAILNIKSQVNRGIANIKKNKSQAIQVFLREAVRNTAQAILMATAFAALATLNSRTSNPLTRFFQFFL